jgi:hypothetical protein
MSSHPQTPQSPSQFSPNVSDLTMSMTGSAASTTTTLPTPAHSVNGSSLTQDTVMSEDSPQHKRKREIDDMGDRAHKKVQVEDRSRRDLDNLHLDVGEKYLLCRTRKAPFYLFCAAVISAVGSGIFLAIPHRHVGCGWKFFALISRPTWGEVEEVYPL